jgi:hypothetical protein
VIAWFAAPDQERLRFFMPIAERVRRLGASTGLGYSAFVRLAPVRSELKHAAFSGVVMRDENEWFAAQTLGRQGFLAIFFATLGRQRRCAGGKLVSA